MKTRPVGKGELRCFSCFSILVSSFYGLRFRQNAFFNVHLNLSRRYAPFTAGLLTLCNITVQIL